MVDGASISVDRLNAVAKADQAAASQQGTQPPTGAALNRQALGELVQSEIILHGAKQEGITVSDADVDAKVNEIRAQVTEQGANFDQALAQRGLTLELLRDQMRPQLAAQRVTAKLVPAKVSDADLAKRRAQFPQAHVRHVLVKDKATAGKVRARLVAGGSWNDLAKQYSQDLSQPVKSQFGYHVIQVIGLRLPPIDDQLREQVEPGLQQRRQDALQRWFKDLAAKAQVRVDSSYGKWNAADATIVDPSAPQTTQPPAGGAPAPSSTP